jgi:hypothetical protein
MTEIKTVAGAINFIHQEGYSLAEKNIIFIDI